MTSKDYSKVKKQLLNKPAKWAKYIKHNKPKERKFGKGVSRCEITGTSRGVIRKYGLSICRRTFRLNAKKVGFKKLD
ncbi:MAG: 30S ribosomal protein S14 [Candidatus Woesearchaeota archaeon]